MRMPMHMVRRPLRKLSRLAVDERRKTQYRKRQQTDARHSFTGHVSSPVFQYEWSCQ